MTNQLNQDFGLTMPFNNLSFGNVAFGITREIYKRGLHPSIFPIGNVDGSAQVPDDGFNKWLADRINNAEKDHSRDNMVLRLWHLRGSMESHSRKNSQLLTFFECNDPTKHEINILKNQDKVWVTNRYTQRVFKLFGIDAGYAPLGFDSHNFKRLEKRPTIEGVTSFLLLGKAEKRKQTFRQLNLWAKKYGNKREYRLNVAIHNPFIQEAHLNALIGQSLEGKQYWNIVFLPFMKTNAEYNSYLQSGDIVLACSMAEGFGLGEYHAAALGAWPVALRAHSYLDFFDDSNSVGVQPNGMEVLHDGIFFAPNQPYNQGSGFTFADDDWYAACEEAECRAKTGINNNGLNLQQKTYKDTVDTLLKDIK